MASVFQVFQDLNHEAAKNVVHAEKPRLSHHGSGLEAPRNSLDIPLATETRGRSFTTPEDVPFGYELHKSHLSAIAIATRSSAKEGAMRASSSMGVAQAFSQESKSKRRAPSVVAQLMGLNDLPDDFLPLAPRKSCHELRSYIEARRSPFKENRPFLLRQQSQGCSAPSGTSMWPPPLPKAMQHRAQFSKDNKTEEPEAPVEALPFRDHPQEKQLQEFKKNFAAQFCSQSQNHHVQPQPVQFKYMKQQLSLAKGNGCNPNLQSKTPGQFQESKEVQEAMDLPQSNSEESLFQFLQQQKPNTVFGHQPLEPGDSWELTEHLAQLKPLKKARRSLEHSPSVGTERKREAVFSPRAFARQFLESLRRHNSKLRQAKVVPGNETKISVDSHNELSRCSSGSTRSRIVEADLSDSYVTTPKAPMSLKISSNLTRRSGDPGRDGSKESAQLLVEEVKERTKQWDRDQVRNEMKYAKQVQGSSTESKEIAQEIIARQAQEAASFTIAKSSLGSSSCSRYEVSLTRSATTGKRVTINRKDMEATGSDIAPRNNNREWSLTPTLKEQVNSSRSCTTSLPNSPHLIQRHDPTVASKLTTTHLIKKAKAVFPDHLDTARVLLPKVLSENVVDPKALKVVKAKRIRESPKPGNLTSNQTTENFKSNVTSSASFVAGKTALSNSCRVDATNSINLNYPNIVMETEKENDHLGWKGCSRDQAKESSPRDAMPMKCCTSVSNASVSSALPNSCRADVTNSISLNYPNTVMETEKENDHLGWKGYSRYQAIESSPRDAMPMKCCSVSNASVSSAHKQGTQSGDGSCRKAISSLGPQQKPNQEISGKALLQSPKAAKSAKKMQEQTMGGRRQLLLVAKTKTCDILDECSSVKNHHISWHDPSPVATHIVQLAEAHVLHNSVLFDADPVDKGGSQAKFCSSSIKANNTKASATRTPCQRPPLWDRSNGADAAGRCICGQNFLEDLSQGTVPQALCLKDGWELAMAECGHAANPNTQNQVEPQKKLRTQEMPQLMTMDLGGADFTFDKNKQPSPISVLESPLEEENPTPIELKEITNDLQGLQVRLRPLEVDGSDRPRADVQKAPPERNLEFAEAFSARVISLRVNASTSSDASSSKSLHNRSQETTTTSHMIDNFLPKCCSACQRLRFRNTLCNMGWKDDLTYVDNMLHSSGVIDETVSIVSRWHFLMCTLRKSIFKRLEACYPSDKTKSSNRWVLFNAINEILFRKLGAHHNPHPFLALKSSAPPTGKKIAEEIWLELYNQRFDLQNRDLHDDYLEMLVARDMTNSHTWSSLHEDIDSIRLHIEHAIFNDLIGDVVQNLIFSYSTLSLEAHA